jgi:hypothetical protein
VVANTWADGKAPSPWKRTSKGGALHSWPQVIIEFETHHGVSPLDDVTPSWRKGTSDSTAQDPGHPAQCCSRTGRGQKEARSKMADHSKDLVPDSKDHGGLMGSAGWLGSDVIRPVASVHSRWTPAGKT